MVITTYKKLIHSMPHANQYLLLYVLDLLSVFARKSVMTAQSIHLILALLPFFKSCNPLLDRSGGDLQPGVGVTSDT
jgi:hypothetical protein